MRPAPKRNRISDEGCCRYQCFYQRGAKGKFATRHGGASRGGNHLLLKSTITEQELFVTLTRPRLAPLIPLRFRDRLSEVLAAAELVAIIERIVACRDPKDDKFLELVGQRPCRSDRYRRRRSACAKSVPRNSDHLAGDVRARHRAVIRSWGRTLVFARRFRRHVRIVMPRPAPQGEPARSEALWRKS